MRIGFARTIAIVVAFAAMAGTSPCLGQDLNIEIPLPELASPSPAKKEVGKRKFAPRGSDAAENRQTARPSLPDTRPSLPDLGPSPDPSLAEEPSADLGPLPEKSETLTPRNKSPRGWAELGTDAGSRVEPSWGNPAGTPLRVKPSAEPKPLSSGREKSELGNDPPRTVKKRSEGKEPAGRGVWLSRWFQKNRRESAADEPPHVARRHRASSTAESSKNIAPPFPARPRLPEPLDLDSLIRPYRD